MTISIKNSKWWQKRTLFERCLIVVAVLLCLLSTNQKAQGFKIPEKTSTSEYSSKSWRATNKMSVYENGTSKNSCETEVCVHTASMVLSKMNKEVKPCDDFYQFACGNFIKETQIPEDQTSFDQFSVISDKVDGQLRAILEEKRSESDPKYLKLPNLVYQACMNTTLIESMNTQPIRDISDSLGGWPVLRGDSWDVNNKWSWQETVKKFRQFGFRTNTILSLGVADDMKKNTRQILNLNEAALGLNKKYLIEGFNESAVLAYYDYMVDIAELFGANAESARIELKESLQFEMDLAKISVPVEKKRNKNDFYNLRTIKELQESYPYVDWLEYINALLPEGLTVDENDVINLSVPSYLKELGDVLNRTNKRAIANYMMWRIHAFAVYFLPENFRQKQLKIFTSLSGVKEMPARWKECSAYVSSFPLSYAVGSLYVRKHFKEESKSSALEMIAGLRAAFKQVLKDIDWMDETTKREAEKKLHTMVSHVGYASKLLDNDKLEQFYRKLEVDPEKYLQSFLNLNVFTEDYPFNVLRKSVNKSDWIVHSDPHVVNAFYWLPTNSIDFPAAVLQGHLFHAERPQYMNYGAIGALIGHEMTHAFDDQGRQYDAGGNLINWWQNQTTTIFLEKAKCIIEQYGNYTDKQTGLKLNGINTQGENIADNGGVKMAYKAYKQLMAGNVQQELRLPGLFYSSKQMFWISFAQKWCQKYRTESLKQFITTDEHAPGEFRVLGTLRNNKDFSRDFQCSEGTPMNPIQKCDVW